MGKYKGRRAAPTTGWSKAATDPLAPQDASSPRIKVGKHIKAPSYKYAGVYPAEPSSTHDERLMHGLSGSPQRADFNPFNLLADAAEDVGLSEADSSDARSATDDSKDTAARPLGQVAGTPSQSAFQAATSTTVDSATEGSLASQPVTGSLPQDNPAWLQLLGDDDDAPCDSAVVTASVPESSATEATTVEKAPARAALNRSTETEHPSVEASAPVACTEALVSKPSTPPPPFVPVQALAELPSFEAVEGNFFLWHITLAELPRYEAAIHVMFVATEALAELPQFEAMAYQPPMNLMQEDIATTKVEEQACRDSDGASEQQAVETRTPASNADQDTSGEASIPAQPAVNSAAPTTLQTTTVMPGAPGMPEGLPHHSEGPLPSIDEHDELFMPEKLPHPALASNHPAPSSSRVGKIIELGWEFGWDAAYSCAGIAVGGYLGWRAGWSKPLSKRG